MRIFIGLVLALSCLACKPTQPSSNEFPKVFQRIDLAWDANIELIYRDDDFDTVAVSEIVAKEVLIPRLKSTPAYRIRELRLQNDAQATFLFDEYLNSDTLAYENASGYYHFWYANNLDEQFYFELEDTHTLHRRFYFYWKKGPSDLEKQIYLRTPALMPPDQVKTMIEQHLIYDAFLESGDTLEMVSGTIVYSKKE